MAERPGVMVYFQWADIAATMQDADFGRLIKAVLTYGKTGEEPRLRGTAKVVWPLIKVQVDKDGARYDQTCKTNAFNRYVGVCKSKGEHPLEFEAWEATLYKPKQRPTTVNER